MKTNPEVIQKLNELFILETTAIAVYQSQADISKAMGYKPLQKYFLEKISDEYSHQRKLSKYILHYEGIPSYGVINSIKTPLNLLEQLEYDLELETQAINSYNAAFHYMVCEEMNSTLAHVLEHIVKDEVNHSLELEQFITQIKIEGIQNVMQSYREVG